MSEIQTVARVCWLARTWLIFVFVIYRWWWELLVLLVLVKLVLVG
jgi:hypothetical protein